MRIACILLLNISSIVAGSVEAAEALDFQGTIVSVNGSIAEIDVADSPLPIFVSAPDILSTTAIGKTASGTCIMSGDLCTATVFEITE